MIENSRPDGEVGKVKAAGQVDDALLLLNSEIEKVNVGKGNISLTSH